MFITRYLTAYICLYVTFIINDETFEDSLSESEWNHSAIAVGSVLAIGMLSSSSDINLFTSVNWNVVFFFRHQSVYFCQLFAAWYLDSQKILNYIPQQKQNGKCHKETLVLYEILTLVTTHTGEGYLCYIISW